MNKVKEPRADVGIIIGRFQVHELHEEHRSVIDTVRSLHDRVIILVGLSPLRNTVNNPLDFNSRKLMIQETYPDVEVYYLDDNRSDVLWSKNLDNQIQRWLKPYQTAVLYGGRDSFIPHYSGRYPTKELEAKNFISATEIRRRISNSSTSNKDYRMGVIAASMSTFPTAYTTVDVAIVDWTAKRILLGRKAGEEQMRFIGGFSTPDSESFEEDAKREVVEETGLEVGDIKYIGSSVIKDWRYRNERDQIKTMFFVATYVFGRPEAADDIAFVGWVSFDEMLNDDNLLVPEHKPLQEMLIKYINKTHAPLSQ